MQFHVWKQVSLPAQYKFLVYSLRFLETPLRETKLHYCLNILMYENKQPHARHCQADWQSAFEIITGLSVIF
jgi:hypothetical protein